MRRNKFAVIQIPLAFDIHLRVERTQVFFKQMKQCCLPKIQGDLSKGNNLSVHKRFVDCTRKQMQDECKEADYVI